MSPQKIKFDLVIYHGGCPDGITAAVLFRRVYPHINTQSCQYGNDPPSVKGKNVVIVDFSFSRTKTIQMFQEANYMVVLDHHNSAQKNLENLEIDPKKGQIIFDMKRAGAQLAWDYLYPGTPRHWLVEYVGDRDLWKLELPYTEELSFAMWFDGYFNDLVRLENLIDRVPILGDPARQPIVKRGIELVKNKNLDVSAYTNLAIPATLKLPKQNLKVRLCCCPRQYRSDVGNLIMKRFPGIDCAAIYWYDHSSNQWWISLRTSRDSPFDLGNLTNDLETGGGHPKAAGFVIKNQSHLRDYFELSEIITVSPKPIPLPNLKEYRQREIDGYLKASKETRFHYNNYSHPVQMTCVPLHYQKETLQEMNQRYPNEINAVFWYDFGRQLWTIQINSNNHNFLDLLGPYPEKYLGNSPLMVTEKSITWELFETEGHQMSDFFH